MKTSTEFAFTILSSLLGVQLAWADDLSPLVSMEQFKVGREWRWTYSSLDKSMGQWQPYYSERYRVAKVDGERITIEMISVSLETQAREANFAKFEPHHKFIVNLEECFDLARNDKKRLKIEMYTRSLDSRWELVSKKHDGLAFTEKFNCRDQRPEGELEIAQLAVNHDEYRIFRRVPKTPNEVSWYFLDRGSLEGIAARKVFEPRRDYKFEFETVEDP